MGSKQGGEEGIVMNENETASDEGGGIMRVRKDVDGEEGGDVNGGGGFSMKSFLWHGGSVYDAWFSCASNQVCVSPPTATAPPPTLSFSNLASFLIYQHCCCR